MRTICPDQHASGCMYVQNDQNMHSSIYSKPTGSCIGEQIRLPSAQAWQRICSSYRPEDKFSESATFDVDTPKFRFGHFQKFCDKGEGGNIGFSADPGRRRRRDSLYPPYFLNQWVKFYHTSVGQAKRLIKF